MKGAKVGRGGGRRRAGAFKEKDGERGFGLGRVDGRKGEGGGELRALAEVVVGKEPAGWGWAAGSGCGVVGGHPHPLRQPQG